MENKLKLRISRMFQASFGSCRTRNLPDVIENAIFTPQNHRNFHMIEPLSPKARPFPSICKPNWSETTESIQQNCIIGIKDVIPRRKVSEGYSPLVSVDTKGRTCPPASPISPFNLFFEFPEQNMKDSKKTRKKKGKKKKTTNLKNKKIELFPFNSFSQETNFGGWFSSDEEREADETETLFSSKSLSSDSSRSRRRRSRPKRHGRNGKTLGSEMGVLSMEGKVKDSFAVVKKSSDPYNDFRTSMVEMIIEKQIFAAKDLEQLLQCFLSLNSSRHHRIIVEVFTEIWEALFSDRFSY